MSFAGHVFDMIRRDKTDREMRQQRRNRIKQVRDKIYEKPGSWPQNARLTSEQLKHMQQQIAAHEKEEERYLRRMTLIIAGICIIVAIVLFLLFR